MEKRGKMFDNEKDVIESFQAVSANSILLLPEVTEELEDILLSILTEKGWKDWIDSSGKADLPPDFYNDKLKIMMDVMKVDDHGFISGKGKTVNPLRQRESEVMRELQDKGILSIFPNAKIFLNVNTDLPTEEDHNYRYYRDNFTRTVQSHIQKINNYKNNHPGYKVVFFVFDESSVYFETFNKNKDTKKGEITKGKTHFWFADSSFVKAFKDSAVDFLIWYTPYKHCEAFLVGSDERLCLPEAVVFDNRVANMDLIEYKEEFMKSAEE